MYAEFGAYIRQERNAQQISRERLSEGICAPITLTKIETEERFADKVNKIKETINKEWNEYKSSLDSTQEINLVGCSFIFVEVETYKYIFENAKI